MEGKVFDPKCSCGCGEPHRHRAYRVISNNGDVDILWFSSQLHAMGWEATQNAYENDFPVLTDIQPDTLDPFFMGAQP